MDQVAGKRSRAEAATADSFTDAGLRAGGVTVVSRDSETEFDPENRLDSFGKAGRWTGRAICNW
jgi:hypothetical protein